MKSGEHHLSFHVRSCLRARVLRLTFPRAVSLFLFLAFGLNCDTSLAQSPSDNTEIIRGIVINSVTREPIARALVSSPDNRFATMTNSEGRFEFTLSKVDSSAEEGSDSGRPLSGRVESSGKVFVSNRPFMLTARKPGFRADPDRQRSDLQNEATKDLTLVLIPEGLIVGTVALPTAEAPDSIMLQIFRRQVQDGRAYWMPAGGTMSKSDGQFRFADLPAGTYKLLTHELLDRDPITSDPRVDPFAADARGLMFGYPPVYYQNAPDFGSAGLIQLAAGQTQTVNLTLVKQPYYPVKVPVFAPGGDAPEIGVGVTVYANGHKGPGFTLGYNNLRHAIEGMLPSGTYTIVATGYQPSVISGMQTITIKGAPIESAGMLLVPSASIPVIVKEEFTSADHTGSFTFTTNGRSRVVNGPRRYLNVNLEPADDFGTGRNVSLRNPGPRDEALVIDGAPAGSYWVGVQSSRGYAASIRSGSLDLQHQPLVVGLGGATSPIEITMRDDMAEIGGTVEGVTPPVQTGVGAGGMTSNPYAGEGMGHLYCIPLADSPGQFTDIWLHPDGSFDSQGLAPGTYRLLAFDHAQTEIEYRNPEAMQAYDSKGPVIRLVGGQKERVTLQLISTERY